MEESKFIINDIYPLMLNVISKDEAILVCLLHQDLDNKFIYTETIIKFKNPTPIRVGAKINLLGEDFKKVIQDKNQNNTLMCHYRSFPSMEASLYYTFKGSSYRGLNYVNLLTPRQTYIKILYLLDVISAYGGYPKSATPIMKCKKINIIKVEKVELEGSKVIEKQNSQTTVIKNSFKFTNGPKEYTVIETLGAAKDISDLDFKTPVPEFVFSKVYKDKIEAHRIYGEDGEVFFLEYDPDKDTTVVYVIMDPEEAYKTSSKYWIKGEL